MKSTTRCEVTHMSTEERTAGMRLNWGDCPGVERDPERLACTACGGVSPVKRSAISCFKAG